LHYELLIGTTIDDLGWPWTAISSNLRIISQYFAVFVFGRVQQLTDYRLNIDPYCQRQRWNLTNVLFTRDIIYAVARICYRPSVRLSVRLSVTRVDHTKTVEVRITKLALSGSPW